MNIKHFLWILGLLLLSACKKDNAEENPIAVSDFGKLNIVFSHTINNQALQLNTNIYINEAGNHYELTDLRYFISDVTLYAHNGIKTSIKLQKKSHYTDIQLPSTLNWEVYDPILTGIYDSISFIFGLNEELNQSSAFVNAPESNMAWPAMLGGGYHYMMMNGKWLNPQNIAVPFNFHLGIGQIYSDTINYDVNTITGYVQNYFSVSLPLTAMQISKNNTTILQLNMAVDSWFKTPHTWDHNYWGSSVMQNQRALQSIKDNGFDVFSITKK